MLRRSSLAALMLGAMLLAGCPATSPTDAGPDLDGGLDAGLLDAGADAGTDAGPAADGGTRLKPCLDSPTDLPRPPGTAGLPCELIPPGFAP